jgi:acyl carrier protein
VTAWTHLVHSGCGRSGDALAAPTRRGAPDLPARRAKVNQPATGLVNANLREQPQLDKRSSGGGSEMTDLAADVIAVIAKRVPGQKDNLKMTDNLTEIGIESIDAIDMIFDLEEKFEVEIPYNANSAQTDFSTVGDIVRAVEQIVARKAASN